jgi:hypothetical protein
MAHVVLTVDKAVLEAAFCRRKVQRHDDLQRFTYDAQIHVCPTAADARRLLGSANAAGHFAVTVGQPGNEEVLSLVGCFDPADDLCADPTRQSGEPQLATYGDGPEDSADVADGDRPAGPQHPADDRRTDGICQCDNPKDATIIGTLDSIEPIGHVHPPQFPHCHHYCFGASIDGQATHCLFDTDTGTASSGGR